MQPDILELLRKHESTHSVVSELQILAKQATVNGQLSTYRQAMAGCSLQAAQNKLYQLSQQIQAELQKAEREAQSEVAELSTEIHTANRLTMPGLKLRPTPNFKALAVLDAAVKYSQVMPQAAVLKIPKIKKLLLNLTSLSKKLSLLVFLKFFAKKLVLKYKQISKKNKLLREKRKQEKLRLDKIKLEKLNKLRPSMQQMLQEQINLYVLREEALLLESAYYAKLKLQNPQHKTPKLVPTQTQDQRLALNLQRNNQERYTMQQTSNLQHANDEQQRLLQIEQQKSQQLAITTEQEKYKLLAQERKLFEQFLASLVEGALIKSAEAKRKAEIDQKDKLAKQKRRQGISLQYAQDWLNAVEVQYAEKLDYLKAGNQFFPELRAKATL